MEYNTSTTNHPPQLCILVLIGLPASGKSTFARSIGAFLEQAYISNTIISYDEQYARIISEKYGKNQSSDFDPGLWHESRKQCLDQVENFIKSNTLPADSRHKHEISIFSIGTRMYVLDLRINNESYKIIDRTGFIEIYLECDVKKAIELNAQRVGDQVVPVKTIEEMNLKLERPDSDKYKWEKHSILLNTAYNIDLGFVAQKIIELWNDPIPNMHIINEEENTKMRLENEKNLIHQADLRLRKVISNLISKYPHISGKQISTWKSEFMAQLKQGKFQEVILAVDDQQLMSSQNTSADQLASILLKIEECFVHQYFP